MVQHASEKIFTPGQVMLAWNVVPGIFCLLFDGLQWMLVEIHLTRGRHLRRGKWKMEKNAVFVYIVAPKNKSETCP